MEFQRAVFLRDAKVADFWEFATSIPRCASVASRESTRLRGSWITPELVVQRVHGYSLSAVRILCVVAHDDDERQRLKDFFTRDQRNLRARFQRLADPMEEEQRVLLKVPYDSSLDGWVEKEYQVLSELKGLPGIPRLYGSPFFFEDLGVKALAMEFHAAPSLQERSGGPVDVYRMACFYLKVLDQVHQLGWIHGDLQPKDLLFQDPQEGTATLRQSETEEDDVSGMICGWSRALRPSVPQRRIWEEDLCELLRALRARALPPHGLTTLRPPSVFSAPEQYVSLYTGEDLESPSTDLYRLGACVASSLALPRHREAESAIETLRRFCHRALLGIQPEDSELQLFSKAFHDATQGVFQLTLPKGAQGLEEWLQRLLWRRGGDSENAGFDSAMGALEALRQAWASSEAVLIAARWLQETPDVEKSPPPSLVLEEPTLLAAMSIV